MIGVDIIKTTRFKKLAEQGNPSFMSRVFTQAEQEYLQNKKLESMAGVFAAKEAVAKALGTGFTGFNPCDIEITHNALGKPHVTLHGNAKAQAKKIARSARRKPYKMRSDLVKIHVSISHSDEDAIAFAVVCL